MEDVVFHSETTSAVYLSTCERGVAHVLSLPTASVGTFWTDSPYTWGAPKGDENLVFVHLGGSAVAHRVQSRTCVQPMVCSLMLASLNGLHHTSVDFDNPDWQAAMRDVGDQKDPERAVYKSTLVRCEDPLNGTRFRDILLLRGRSETIITDEGGVWTMLLLNVALRPSGYFSAFLAQATYRALQKRMGACPFKDSSGQACGGHWVVVFPGGGRRPFVGCSEWRPGDAGSRSGGHFGAAISCRDSPEVLDELQKQGPWTETDNSERCTFIAPKGTSPKVCHLHGGLEPHLRRSGEGTCGVHARLYIPRGESTAARRQVIVVLRGTHQHTYPVLRPSAGIVKSLVADHCDQSVRTLQVRSNFSIYVRLTWSVRLLSRVRGPYF